MSASTARPIIRNARHNPCGRRTTAAARGSIIGSLTRSCTPSWVGIRDRDLEWPNCRLPADKCCWRHDHIRGGATGIAGLRALSDKVDVEIAAVVAESALDSIVVAFPFRKTGVH